LVLEYTENIPDMPVRKIKLQRMLQLSGRPGIMGSVHDHYRFFGDQGETSSPVGFSESFVNILSGNRIAKLLKHSHSLKGKSGIQDLIASCQRNLYLVKISQ